MSYVRFADDSEVYLIGTFYDDKVHVIECCGCRFTPMTTEEPPDIVASGPDWARGLEWYAEPFPAFTAIPDALAHLDKHRSAGHRVPDRAYDRIRSDDWLVSTDG